MHPTHHPLQVRLLGPASSSLSPEDAGTFVPQRERILDGPAQFDSFPVYTVVSISQLDLASAALQQRWTTLLSPQRLRQFLGTAVTHAAGRLKVRPQCLSCLASAFQPLCILSLTQILFQLRHQSR